MQVLKVQKDITYSGLFLMNALSMQTCVLLPEARMPTVLLLVLGLKVPDRVVVVALQSTQAALLPLQALVMHLTDCPATAWSKN